MRKAQYLLITLVSLLLLACTVVLIIQNLAIPVSVQFLTWVVPTVPLGAALAVTGLLLGLCVGLQMWNRMLVAGEQAQRTSRNLERQDVSREEAESKVNVLESKIQTLEKALAEALKRS